MTNNTIAYVFQAKNPTFDAIKENTRITVMDLERDFNLAAKVIFTDGDVAEGSEYLLDKVFELTNHIGRAWWDANAESVKRVAADARSTSVGDIVALADEAGTQMYCVDRLGWTKLIAA